MRIFLLVFVCGLVSGVVLTGVFASRQIHPVKQVVFTDTAPQPIGPYSQAVTSENLVFLLRADRYRSCFGKRFWYR